MRQRLIGGVMVAVALAGGVMPNVRSTARLPKPHDYGIVEALCSIYEKDSAMYILLGCALLPPAGDGKATLAKAKL